MRFYGSSEDEEEQVPVTRRLIGIIALVFVAAAFLYSAVSGDVYEITSPVSFPFHTLLHKFYSVVAFAVIGYLTARLTNGRPRRYVFWIAVLAGANFSAVIEIVQGFISSESLSWHLIDVGCGALGGAFGGALAAARWVQRR